MIGIVVLNYNTSAETIACIESLAAQKSGGLRIYVIDNGSHETHSDRLRRFFSALGDAPSEVFLEPNLAPVRTRFLGANRGYAAGNNVGIEMAFDDGCDSVLLLNSDATLEPDALAALRDCKEQASSSVIGLLILDSANPSRIESVGGFSIARWSGRTIPRGMGRSSEDASRIDSPLHAVHGAAMLIPRSVTERVGLLREDYFLYYEEVDFAVRCQRAGIGLSVCLAARVHHVGGASTGTSYDLSVKSTLATYYATRNAVAIAKRFWPVYVPSVVLARLAYLLVAIFRGQARLARPILMGAFDGLVGRMGARPA